MPHRSRQHAKFVSRAFSTSDAVNDAQFPARQRLKTEQIVSTQLFRDWIVSPSSAKLLVKWDTHKPRTIAGTSPLSVFCTTIARALQTKESFVSLLWFCGRHVDADQPVEHLGAIPMLFSLIDQLLRQHPFEMRPLHQEISLEGLQNKSVDALTKLLGWLVRRLPRTVTVVCIIDGVALFERDEFLEYSLTIFGSILGLTVDQSVAASVKVLFTSIPGPEYVQVAFENENVILNVDSLPHMSWAPNDERISRTLEEQLVEE
ncbi:hypothetical protein CPLU01_10607 [Colletotrichum plurivorum]|uniref:Nephrocystin 3-like N-terminal domain-containing protein n=1 Tax=Colletotrichum plurivorum TaxID=2175906 RepID=A0A8H6K5I3_9PEZI|nr:hypothetical protein CPLU01_10607 [Colletotrichum plurivorum]